MHSRTALRGRDAEVARLARVLERLRDGRGTTVVIEGEAGIGKSRLIESLAADARAEKAEVYVGRTSEIDTAHPLAAVADALAPLREDLPGALWGDDGGPRGLRLYEAASDELERRSIRRPVVVCFEDVHWADADTLQFVRILSRRTANAPLGLVLSTRPIHAVPQVAQLVDRLVADGAQVIVPTGLPPDAVASLVEDVLGSAPGPRVLTAVARANGNPFLVRELVSALLEEGAIEDGDLAATAPALPPSFRLVVLRRLATLPTETREDLRVAAILGTTFSIDDLSIVVERSAIDLLRTLSPALAAGFLIDRSGQLSFSHDLVRSTLYEDIPEGMRRSIHARIGHALAQAGRDAVAIASHVAIAAEPGDHEAVDTLIQATLNVASVSFDAMLTYLQHAIRISTPSHPRFSEIAAQLVAVLLNVGRLSEGEARAREILGAGQEGDSGPFLVAYLAEALTARGALDEAAELNQAVVEDETGSADGRAIAASDLAKTAVLRGDLREAERYAAAAASFDEEPGYPIGRLGAAYARCLIADASGDVVRARTLGGNVAELEDLVYETGRANPTTRTATGLAFASVDRFDDSLEQLGRSALRLEDAGSVLATSLQHVSAWVRYVRGDWDAALADAETTVALDANERFDAGFANEFAMLAFAATGRILLHRDDIDGARELADRAGRWVAAGIPRLDGGALEWLRALVLEADGDGRGALDLMSQAWLAGAAHRYLGGVWRFLAPEIVRHALDAGRTDLARKIADDVCVQQDQGATAPLAASRVCALVESDADALIAAADGLHGAGRMVEAASTTVEAAIASGRAGSERSAQLFRDAAARFEDLGATRSVRRTHSLMRTYGIRAGVRGRRGRPTSGWESLTSTELSVIALVGEGLTNGAIADRLFISPRTVQTHLRNVFGKLGVSSRAEVAAEAVRRNAAERRS